MTVIDEGNLSLAQKIAMLPPDQRGQALDGLDPDDLLHDWQFWARPSQKAPPGSWGMWCIMAGRGFGKNRSASEWMHERVRKGFAKRIALLGRTAADVRDVIIMGESGLIATARPGEVPLWEPSKRKLTWPNGAFALAFSSDEPDQLRGPQFDSAIVDEFASFPQMTGADGATAFDNLRLGLRLPVDGDEPRMVVTTTPRRVASMFKILEEARDPKFGIVLTRGTTYENLGNLADAFRNTILGLYEGTRLGRQELMGEMLADIEGALFLQEWFDANRVDELPPGRMFSVVGVDPSVAERPSDECGIVVVRATMDKDLYRRHLYVVEDASVKGSPSVWAAQVARMSRKWNAPVVAEGNQGGELVRMAIAQADTNLPVHIVHAKSGKATRAEPVAALFEQGRGHMLGWHGQLEDQLANWIPADSRYSPDRLDALTWACLSLSTRQKGLTFALGRHLRARSSRGRLPQITAANLAMKSSGRR
jgi:phage terminase large subunit-like protein